MLFVQDFTYNLENDIYTDKLSRVLVCYEIVRCWHILITLAQSYFIIINLAQSYYVIIILALIILL